jgi:DNA-binding beta-propeller fold protein YncE
LKHVFIGAGIALTIGWLAINPARAADLIVSANDGKFVRVQGNGTFPRPAPPDSLVVIDASSSPPKVVATLEGIEHTVQGPPQAVAISPDGKLAVIAAPSRWDEAAGKEVLDTFLQVVDLEANPPRVVSRVELGAHPNGISISPGGNLLLAAMLDGTVRVLTISGKTVTQVGQVKLSDRRLASVTFTHDGKAALVSIRDDGGIATLAVDGTTVTDTKERVSSGIAPYSIDISSDGKWAVASNAGLNGLPGFPGSSSAGDADIVTLIDVSHRPFHAVQHLSVPSTPEAVAISPDGRWIVVQAMDGSNLAASNPGRHAKGKVLLFSNRDGRVELVNELPGGDAAQGIVFGQDNRTVLVQFDVEKAIAVYAVQDGRLVDTGQRLPLAAGPVSIRTMPR